MPYELIPVVPEGGALCEDLTERGKCGYAFSSVDVAVEKIKNVDFGIVKTVQVSMNRFSFERLHDNIHNFIEEERNN